MKRRLSLLGSALILLLAAACVSPTPTLTPVLIDRTIIGPTATATKAIVGKLTVFAASSLTDVFLELGRNFQTDHPGTQIFFQFAGTNQLAALIKQDKVADIFASANTEQFNLVAAAGKMFGGGTIFTRNRLVVVTSNANPGKIATLKDLANPGLKIVIAMPTVPLRSYTDQMLARWIADPTFGPDFKAAFTKNVAFELESARRVLGKVLGGEADAGIVYASDVTPEVSAGVYLIPIPDSLNVVAEYTLGIVKAGANRPLSGLFIDYVMSASGQAIFKKWGFMPLAGN